MFLINVSSLCLIGLNRACFSTIDISVWCSHLAACFENCGYLVGGRKDLVSFAALFPQINVDNFHIQASVTT